MELVEIDGKMFLKKSLVYSGIANQRMQKLSVIIMTWKDFLLQNSFLICGAEMLQMY